MESSNSLSPTDQRPALRRLSSQTATEKEVTAGGRVVVVPEKMLAQQALTGHNPEHGFAASMESAKEKLNKLNLEENALESSPESSSPETPGSPASPGDIPSADTFAFAFDIDGVLIRGGRPIPEAVQAMKVLNGENEYGVKM